MKNQQIQTNSKMKNVMMLTIFLGVTITSFGQNKNVTKATNLLTKVGTLMANGESAAVELSEAAELIEPAITFEKTMLKGKTWYTRAQIYDKIFQSADESLNAKYPNALKTAVDSYLKTIELEKEGSTFGGLAELAKQQMYDRTLNKGVENYNNKNLEAAYKNFVDVASIKPTDTTGYLYAGMVAQENKQYDNTLVNYEKLIELGEYSTSVIFSVITIYQFEKEELETALKYAKIGQEKFPSELEFQRKEVDILIKMDKLDEAIIGQKTAISNEPNKVVLVANLAMLYDMTNNLDSAEVYYKQALEMEPTNRNSLINLSVLYISKGNKIMEVVNDMTVKEYSKHIDKAEKESSKEYNQAIPLLERVLEMDETDRLGLQNLQAVYAKLKDGKRSTDIYNKRKELGYVSDED